MGLQGTGIFKTADSRARRLGSTWTTPNARGVWLFKVIALAVAITQPSSPASSGEDATNGQDAPPGIIDAGHARASAGVRGLGAWLDRLFSDQNYEAELNESWLRLRLDSFASEEEGPDAEAKARLYLKLPALGERVRAEILSSAEREDAEAADGAAVGPPPPERDEGNISAALSYFFRNDEDRSVSARLGFAFDGYTPDPYAGVRFRAHVPLNDDWNFRFVERVRFYSLDGLESRTSFGLDRGLAGNRLFRATASGVWLHEEEIFSYSLGFTLFEPLGEKSAIEYQLLNAFSTNPHNLEQVTTAVRYRRQAWRKWLILEVAPQFAFPDDHEFEPVPGIFLRLEATFGG